MSDERRAQFKVSFPVHSIPLRGNRLVFGTVVLRYATGLLYFICAMQFGFAAPARAATYNLIHRFEGGSDGEYPMTDMVVDSSGDVYGTTQYGGGDGCPFYSLAYIGCGTVYEFTHSGTIYSENILYRFRGGFDGGYVSSGLTRDPTGTFYGVTSNGGFTVTCKNAYARGCGTVFELAPNGSGYAERPIYRFRNDTDGFLPSGTLAEDASGALYGTAYRGGVACSLGPTGCGVIFKLAPNGQGGFTFSVLYHFAGKRDGATPVGGLTLGANGVLYGVTLEGGSNKPCYAPPPPRRLGCGVLYRLRPGPSGYTEDVLYRFRGYEDGAQPRARPLIGRDGTLYGTTLYGAAGFSNCRIQYGCGTMYELQPSGTGFKKSTLIDYSWTLSGSSPIAGLTMDSNGALLATAQLAGPGHGGTLFEFDANGGPGALTMLYAFTGQADGYNPGSTLVQGSDGTLYGTTLGGGNGSRCDQMCGTFFSITK